MQYRATILICKYPKSERIRMVKQLLLSSIEPHQESKKPQSAKFRQVDWIKTISRLEGVDTSFFTSHHTRTASTFKAKVKSLPTEDILKKSNWSKKSILQKHYHKFISSKTATVV